MGGPDRQELPLKGWRQAIVHKETLSVSGVCAAASSSAGVWATPAINHFQLGKCHVALWCVGGLNSEWKMAVVICSVVQVVGS